jgi:diguanylate cyclase (GGDEF)-like protein/PAS domain S-box-containing protein
MDAREDAGSELPSRRDELGGLLGEAALRAVPEGLPDATVAATRDGRIVFANEQAEELFGYDRDELLGRPVQTLWPERMRERYTRNMQLYFATEHPLRFSTQAYGVRRDGSQFVGEMSWGIVETDGGPLLLAIGRDVSERRAAELRLRRYSEQQAAVAALGERALAGADVADLGRDAIECMQETLDVDRVEIHGAERLAWEREPARGEVASAARLEIRTGEDVFGALTVESARADALGEYEQSFLRAIATVLATAMSRLRDEERVRHQALHDPLTGLANRTLCRDRLTHAMALATRGGGSAGVLFIDLDSFKRINDLFGHAAGDEVLVALGRRLAAVVRPADTVARLGGDEFVVVCDAIDDDAAIALGRRLEEAVRAPLTAGGAEHRLTASVGIALGGAGRTDPEALLAEADAAAYRAKAEGRGRVEMFDTRLRRRAQERLQTAEALESALPRHELSLAFQPIVRLADGAVVAEEALLRWERPGGGPASPGLFIPVAEESALIVDIGGWALREACRSIAPVPERSVWVNLSGRQVAQADLAEIVADCLRETGLPPQRLRLELTESVLLEAGPAALRTLDGLERLGVGIVLDDFGTGQSSLQHLRDFPVAGVKIDRSFVAGVERAPGDRAVVDAIVGLGAALGLDVVAEGVEREQQAAVLRELGCPLAQGYLFGRPAQRNSASM